MSPGPSFKGPALSLRPASSYFIVGASGCTPYLSRHLQAACPPREVQQGGRLCPTGSPVPLSSSGPQRRPHRSLAPAPSSWAAASTALTTKGAAGSGPTMRLDPPRRAHVGFGRGPRPAALCPGSTFLGVAETSVSIPALEEGIRDESLCGRVLVKRDFHQ
ncbi:hypothetical protein NDU88_000233 [Pleurodeles waltl]|uniref:Uncharacterized protein n=1 Tax=Pleurodeles waltl TaxID=8319 RepID=A0AAV7LVA7_PLEWA|nr:hypothetical protein NDU88_000233 [Pleurodeles waltl]